IMPAFIDLNGTPMTANAHILNDIVRKQWGFSGVMVSDYGAVAELMVHGVAANLAESAAMAMKAGDDIDLTRNVAYPEWLPQALDRGRFSIGLIGAAARRVLSRTARLDLLADPYRRCGPAKITPGRLKARRALAYQAACRSIVLLTGRNDVLPLGDKA